MKLKSLALPLLAAAFVLAAAPAFAAMTVKALAEGVKVTYTNAKGETVTLKPGDTVPEGVEVKVAGGKADFQSGAVTISAPEGASFKQAATAKGMQLNPIAGNITAAAGDNKYSFKPGSVIAVNVAAGFGGKVVDIGVVSGPAMQVTYPSGRTSTVEAGKAIGEGVNGNQSSYATSLDETVSSLLTTTVNNPLQETTVASPSAP